MGWAEYGRYMTSNTGLEYLSESNVEDMEKQVYNILADYKVSSENHPLHHHQLHTNPIRYM